MNNPLRTPDEYELFLYTLQEHFAAIRRSTLVFRATRYWFFAHVPELPSLTKAIGSSYVSVFFSIVCQR